MIVGQQLVLLKEVPYTALASFNPTLNIQTRNLQRKKQIKSGCALSYSLYHFNNPVLHASCHQISVFIVTKG